MTDTFLALALAVTAALFAAIGQAGGAGYVAVLAVGGQAPDAIRPAALAHRRPHLSDHADHRAGPSVGGSKPDPAGIHNC